MGDNTYVYVHVHEHVTLRLATRQGTRRQSGHHPILECLADTWATDDLTSGRRMPVFGI